MASPHKENSSTAPGRMFGKAGAKNPSGRSGPPRSAGTSPHKPSSLEPRCPECGSAKTWKDGLRQTSTGRQVQRYLCRNCGFRFSFNDLDNSKHAQRIQRQFLKSMEAIPYYRQICAAQPTGAKNLAAVENHIKSGQAGAAETTKKAEPADVKGKIIEFAWWMKKQGYADATIEGRVQILKRLVKLGADLWNPETVKDIIARQKGWTEGRKFNAVVAYTTFLQMYGLNWQPPRCRRIRKLPFIPLEAEIDQLIAACSKKISAFLQLLKETGMRSGEAWQLKWADLDLTNNTVRVNDPEKGSEPRLFKISSKLAAILNSLPKNSEKIFGSSSIRTIRRLFQKQRQRVAQKLGNPRILNITFHTLRHWKATMEYHKTKDILYVMKVLGHKNIKNTLIYTQLIPSNEDDFICKIATTIEEAKQLIEAGFEYVCDMENVKLFRKRK